MLEDGLHDIPTGKQAAVVTYLEMHALAPSKPVDLPNTVSFRSVDANTSWYRDIFNRVGAQDWLWSSRLKLSDAALNDIISDPLVEIYTLTQDGSDEALLELDFRSNSACELAFFGLTSKLIGTGAGRFLMNRAIETAWSRPIDLFHVHTCTLDSPQALGFYRRSGFVPVRQQIEIEDDPRVTGLLPNSAGAHVPIFKS